MLTRIGPLASVVLMHIAFFYAVQTGLARETTRSSPKEVIATFVSPPRASTVQEPKPVAPKEVPVVKKAPVRPARKPKPVARPTPAPQPVAVPPVAPAMETPPPSQPAVPASSAPAAESASSAAAAPAAPTQPKTITTGIEYIQAPAPQYPRVSKRLGEQGRVLLRVLVNEKGQPLSVEVRQSSGSARLDEAARQAVSRAVFKPFIENGRPEQAFALVPINFQLDS